MVSLGKDMCKMKCKMIDNEAGGLVCFFSNEFLDNKENSEALTNSIYTRLVFLDGANESIIPCVNAASFPGKIDICFCNPNIKGLAEAIELRKQDRIRNIFITPNCVYTNSEPDFLMGYECWDNVWAPDSLHPYDDTARQVLDINDLLLKAGTIAKTIAAMSPVSDLEKILLVDAWIQQNIQYATGRESSADGGVYICESISAPSNVHDPLLHGYGRCEDIALTAALILNHPVLGIHCRQVGASRSNGFNHSWNIVNCNGNEYYTDFTHNITRNPHRASGALRATSYSYQFTLLGINDAAGKYGTTELYSCKDISLDSLDREEIMTTALSLQSRDVLKTKWDPSPIIPSVFVKNE